MPEPNETSPEIPILKSIINDILLHFSLNNDLLFNWLTELIDYAHDSSQLQSVLCQDVIWAVPEHLLKTAITKSQYECLILCINQLNVLDDEVYLDFKLIIYELLRQCFSSYTSRCQLYTFGATNAIVDDYMSFLSSVLDWTTPAPHKLASEKSKFIVQMTEIGIDSPTLKLLMAPLLAKSRPSKSLLHIKTKILELLTSISSKYPSQYPLFILNAFRSSSLPIPLPHEVSQKCFTIYSWFKVAIPTSSHSGTSSDTSIVPLFSLTNSSTSQGTSLYVQLANYNQVMIEILDSLTNSRMRYTFNRVIDESLLLNGVLAHLALSYDHYQNLSLFVNGEKTESIPCPSLDRFVGSWNKLYVGYCGANDDSTAADRDLSRDELLLNDLTLLNCLLSEEWIATMYALGPGFDWNSKDLTADNIFDVLNHLTPYNLTLLGSRVALISAGKLSRASRRHRRSQKGHSSNGPGISERRRIFGKAEIAALLQKSSFGKQNVLLNCSDPHFMEYVSRSTLMHSADSFNGSLYCLGGANFLVTLFEKVTNECHDVDNHNHLLMICLQFVMTCIRNSWRIYKEFENNDCFHIFSLLLRHYKTKYNVELNFGHILGGSSILDLFLLFTTSIESSEDLLICDLHAYRKLVLDFDLYDGTVDLPRLNGHLASLVTSRRFSNHNMRVLSKVKLLKRLTQFMRRQLFKKNPSMSDSTMLRDFLHSALATESSVEAIRSFARFVIFALYGDGTKDSVDDLGVSSLYALTNGFFAEDTLDESLKRFSRLITIHWILLLFPYKNDQSDERIVCRGIELLAKLLQVLGPAIIKRFFQVNRGLEMLTHYLSSWWLNDQVIMRIVMAAFGLTEPKKHDDSLSKVLDHEKISKSTKIAVPEFLLILNNMVLTAMCDVSLRYGEILSVPSSPVSPRKQKSTEDEIFSVCFNSIHLANQHVDFVKAGITKNPALKSIFQSKDWLEGAVEIFGHLRLASEWASPQFGKSFRKCSDRWADALADIFLEKVLDARELFAILKSLNDITVKLILSTVFPKIFYHSTQMLLHSAEDGRHYGEYAKNVGLLLEFYYAEYVLQKFTLSDEDLDRFLTCLIVLIESENTSKHIQAHHRVKLKTMIGHLVVLKLSGLSVAENLEIAMDEEVKNISYKQVLFLQNDVLTDSFLSQVVEILLGNFIKLPTESQFRLAEHFINLLRAGYIMRQSAFKQVQTHAAVISDYDNSEELIGTFFEYLVTRNDEEIIRHLQRFPAVRNIFTKNLQFRLSKIGELRCVNLLDMVKVTLSNGGRLAYMDGGFIKNFETDCEGLKGKIIKDEVTKYNREIQDNHDNNDHAVTSLSRAKNEVYRVFEVNNNKKPGYVLDYIEGADRMRKFMVVEDQLAESEKLYYAMEVPIKRPVANETFDSFDDGSFSELNAMHDSTFAPQTSLGDATSGSDSCVDVNDFDTGNEDIDDIDDEEDYYGENDGDKRTGIGEDRNRKVIRSLFLGDKIQALWNVSRINGLEAVVSLMVMGNTHVYLLENYCHCSDGNVVDSDEAPPELKDPYLQLVNAQNDKAARTKAHHTKSWALDKLASVTKRKFLLRDIALEMFFSDGASILITCLNSKDRDTVYQKLIPFASGKGLDKDLAMTLELSSYQSALSQSGSQASSSSSSFASKLASALASGFTSGTPQMQAATRKWCMGEMSNFYYLMVVNTVAGRTFNDLTQYPVFPWVLADYTSEKLDLSNPETFRDFSKPMGAQSDGRKRQFQERYDALESLQDDNAPPFHYGTHYSSAMIVSSYLIRVKPYVQSYLLLQGGKFDHADRLFSSVEKAWNLASRDNTTDVRELTPEFFYLPEFLVNDNDFEFGYMQDGNSVGDVELPPWAHGDAKIFIAKNREALESPYVSANLHKWIDLVFGYKQNGEEAVKNVNVFHHLSYNGAINVDDITDEVERRAVIGMINNFGQTPMQVFLKGHMEKIVFSHPNLYLQMLDLQKLPPVTTFESKLSLPVDKLEFSEKLKRWIGRPRFISAQDDVLVRKTALEIAGNGNSGGGGSLIINNILYMNVHLGNITALAQIGEKLLVTGASDGVIHIWQTHTGGNNKRVKFVTTLRGHMTQIHELRYSGKFKVGLSSDILGNVIVWDYSRFSFVRKLPSGPGTNVFTDICNDSGNIATVHCSRYSNVVSVYTINGEVICRTTLPPGKITCIGFAGMADKQHVFWSSDLLAVCYSTPRKNLQLYELSEKSSQWCLGLIQSVDLQSFISGSITAVRILRYSHADEDDKLCRGSLKAVVGDACGKVYFM